MKTLINTSREIIKEELNNYINNPYKISIVLNISLLAYILIEM